MANSPGFSAATGSNSEVVSVVARSIDLCAVLINNSNSSNPIMHAVVEVSQWLGRERLNRYELQDCLSKARGAAFPNMTAELLLEDVRKGTHTMVAGPFFPRASGSLGRLMANDPNLSWMVTTVTCLFQFHSNIEVNRCVRDLIVAAVRKESDTEIRCHDPSRVHLARVVDKIVSSIWFNVVNAGRMTVQLPEELTSICGNGHHLESPDFATVVEALRSGKPRLMVRSQHLLYNIVLWLLYHFDGFLQVVVGGKIIYKKELGERHQAIEFRVDRSCAGTGSCGVRERATFEVFEDISDNPKCFFSGLYNPPKARSSIETAMVRRKLYQLPDAHLVESRARQHGIQILIKGTAQKMMRWVLSLGVSSPYDFTNLGFRVQVEGEPEAKYRKIRDLLHRSPSILNQRWGDSQLSNVVFCMPVSNADGRSMSGTSESGSRASTVYQDRQCHEIVPYFPILKDLLDEIRPICRCLRCEDHESLDSLLVEGCLLHIALIECLALMAHGIADGFGVTDASGVLDVKTTSTGMLYLLLDIVEEQGILWDIWFGVAASVYLGCACPCLPNAVITTNMTSTTAAIQYGDLAVVAPWLNLNQTLQIEGCFKLIEVQGRLSIGTPISAHEVTCHEVAENYALIRTERTELIPQRELPHEFWRPGSNITITTDSSPTEIAWIMSQTSDSDYDLMMRVESTGWSRIIDPSSAIIRIAREITTLDHCPHSSGGRSLVLEAEKGGMMYSFNDLLGLWESWENTNRFISHNPLDLGDPRHLIGTVGTVHIAERLGSLTKQNIAFALSVNENLIWSDGSACLECLLGQAKKARPPHPLLDRPPHDYYIINVEKSLKPSVEDRRTLTRKQVTGPRRLEEDVPIRV